MNKLVDFILDIEKKKPITSEEESILTNAFLDTIPTLEMFHYDLLPQIHEELTEVIEKPTEEFQLQESQTHPSIKLYSKVRVKYLNKGTDLTVCITQKESKSFSKTNGIQNIYINSPLARSLIGRKVGDTVKVGNLDNYVEVLEVIN